MKSNKRVKSCKIWSRYEMDDDNLFLFGWTCFNEFKKSIESNQYGDDWTECAYSNDYYVAYAVLSKNGMASISVMHNPH